MKKTYVAGFLFDMDFEHVVLIKKEKPIWQKGLLNGVGGKIEEHTQSCRSVCEILDSDPPQTPPCNCHGETAHAAMTREFLEETGLEIESWKRYVELTGEGFSVVFFYANVENPWLVETLTDEEVDVYPVEDLKTLHTIPNLQWLIPMSQTMQFEGGVQFVVTEYQEAHA